MPCGAAFKIRKRRASTNILFYYLTFTRSPITNKENNTKADFILLTNSYLIADFPSSDYLLKINYR